MGIFSPFTVIRGLSLVHLSAAYFMLVSPKTLAEQNIVIILGGAMKIVCIPCSFSQQSL